jgi:hypothetical protein
MRRDSVREINAVGVNYEARETLGGNRTIRRTRSKARFHSLSEDYRVAVLALAARYARGDGIGSDIIRVRMPAGDWERIRGRRWPRLIRP